MCEAIVLFRQGRFLLFTDWVTHVPFQFFPGEAGFSIARIGSGIRFSFYLPRRRFGCFVTAHTLREIFHMNVCYYRVFNRRTLMVLPTRQELLLNVPRFCLCQQNLLPRAPPRFSALLAHREIGPAPSRVDAPACCCGGCGGPVVVAIAGHGRERGQGRERGRRWG